MKILFLGAGGVGGYFGGRLIESGADAVFLVRPDRQARLKADGLRVESPHGNLTLSVATVTRDAVEPVYDLVVVAPKSYDLEDAIASIQPAVGPGTFVLPLLNGVVHMDVLDAQLGRNRVLGGVAHIAATMSAEGTIRQLTEMHSLTVGGRDPGTQTMAQAFIEMCSTARFDSRLVSNIESVLWEKWAFLAALAGMTTLMRCPVGEIMDTDCGDRLARSLYSECLGVAAANDFPVEQTAQQRALGMLTQKGSAFAASMLRDLESGQRTEHEHVLGEMVRSAARHGLAAPILDAAFTNMQIRARRAP